MIEEVVCFVEEDGIIVCDGDGENRGSAEDGEILSDVSAEE